MANYVCKGRESENAADSCHNSIQCQNDRGSVPKVSKKSSTENLEFSFLHVI